MTKLDEILGAPPPPAYEKVAKHRVGDQMPGGLNAALWHMILSRMVDKRLQKEEQANAWSALHRDVRFVCKDFYLVCMHLLRSQFLHRYIAKIRAPFTSDPYPTGRVVVPSGSQVRVRPTLSYDVSQPSRSGNGAGRETRVLDLFIAAGIRSDVEAFQSSLLESTFGEDEQGESDLFTVHQPRSRLEDLVIALGREHNVLLVDEDDDDVDEIDYYHQAKRAANRSAASIDARNLAIDLRGRSASLRLRNPQSASRALRTIFEVSRQRDDSLESTARQIVRRLIAMR